VATVIGNVYCPACGSRHTICLPDSDIVFSNREYEYDCPSAGRTVRLPKDELGEAASVCPPQALLLREVKS
jgi:hypothetical protein